MFSAVGKTVEWRSGFFITQVCDRGWNYCFMFGKSAVRNCAGGLRYFLVLFCQENASSLRESCHERFLCRFVMIIILNVAVVMFG